jgi:transcriptional regulator with XRE-family HTH domain
MNNINSGEIEIGEKIKSFRKKRDITQEQLAEYLNISFQSVSKWERSEAYPDITMLPKIALFFGVTTDELLCVDKVKTDQEIEEYFKRKNEAHAVGHTKEAIEIMREANAKYPGNFRVMDGLAGAIYFDACAHDENQKEAFREVISIGEKIRAECRDDNIRRDSLQCMCFCYRHLGENDKAENLINENLGGVYLSREIMLEHVLEGERLVKLRQGNLVTFMDFCISNIQRLSKGFNPVEKLAAYKNILQIYSILFPDNDFGYYGISVSGVYMDIAGIYLSQGESENALENIGKAAEHAVIFDNLALPMRHTSPLVNKSEFTGITKNYTGNQSYNLLKKLENEKYDIVRDMPLFKEICENMQKYASEKA